MFRRLSVVAVAALFACVPEGSPDRDRDQGGVGLARTCRPQVLVSHQLRALVYEIEIGWFDVGDHVGGRVVRSTRTIYVDDDGNPCASNDPASAVSWGLFNHGSSAPTDAPGCYVAVHGCSFFAEPRTADEIAERDECLATDRCFAREVVDAYCDARCGNCDYDLPLDPTGGHNSNNDFDAQAQAFAACVTNPNATRSACDECLGNWPKFESQTVSDDVSCRCTNRRGDCDVLTRGGALQQRCTVCGGDRCQWCGDMSTCSAPSNDGNPICCDGKSF